MKKIMILGASILQLPAIRKAKELGLSVVAVDMNPLAVGFLEDGIEREIISTLDIPAVVAAAKRHAVDGVMTLASDMPMRTVAAVARELGLVGISEETAEKATNKASMRKALREGGVPIPEFYRVSSEEEFRAAVQKLPAPFIVKPADNSGSRGIVKIEDKSDTEQLLAAYRYSRSHARGGDVVAEEYMTGPEVSVETLTVDGICHIVQITDKITTGAPHFVEMGHTQPSGLPEDTLLRIAEVARAANRALGIDNGPSHTEVIVTEEGPKIVELGARLGGDCITTHLVPLSTGVDMVASCLRIALGESPSLTTREGRGAAIRYLRAKPGKILSIDGCREAETLPGIAQVSIVHGVGETATEIESSSDRLGFVIASASNREEAVRRCEDAVEKIKIEVE